MSVKLLLSVAAGGALGAVCRYGLMSLIGHTLGRGFPWGTLAVNVLGSFVLGLFIEFSALQWSPSPELRAFVVVGVLGALTTFSTLSLDVFYLIERGETPLAASYVVASLVLGIGGLFGGLHMARAVLL